jgi:acylphosphatase
MTVVSFKLTVTGEVQGVAFRASMRDFADQEGVKGWVRNRDDGAVEALVQGEEAQVERIIEWARVGPPGARVKSLARNKVEGYPPQAGFRILVQSYQRRATNR